MVHACILTYAQITWFRARAICVYNAPSVLFYQSMTIYAALKKGIVSWVPYEWSFCMLLCYVSCNSGTTYSVLSRAHITLYGPRRECMTTAGRYSAASQLYGLNIYD